MLLSAVWTLTAPIHCRGSISTKTFISVPQIGVIQVWNDREHTVLKIHHRSHGNVLSLAVIHSRSFCLDTHQIVFLMAMKPVCVQSLPL